MTVSTNNGHFCYTGGFGDLGDPVVPTLRDESRDVVTIYAYYDTKGRFLQPLAFPRPGHGPRKRWEMTISTNNGLHVCMEWYTTC